MWTLLLKVSLKALHRVWCDLVQEEIFRLRKAEIFLKEADQFQLGQLPTESFHPKSVHLSYLAQSDVEEALKVFAQIEFDAVSVLQSHSADLMQLKSSIEQTLSQGGKIFLCGCGATGRLSISLETLWRQVTLNTQRFESVRSFIAGGDFALVKSIENFEDHPEFGVKQLYDLGFQEKDLLIATSEGGETPFVIGAALEAAKASKQKPYFLFCNPKDLLIQTTKRSREIIENPQVHSISFYTGPMALSGSTRLQATTALMLAVGSCLFAVLQNQNPQVYVQEFLQSIKSHSWENLKDLVLAESELYKENKFCIHQAEQHAITVLTDTTERTPTFSLLPFENPSLNEPMAWTYLSIPSAKTTKEAWQKILCRQPRSLDWSAYSKDFGIERTLQYDFSQNSLQRRLNNNLAVEVFKIETKNSKLKLSLKKAFFEIPLPESLLIEHLLLKLALNMTSTIVMARLGRIVGNVMVYVRPTNKKLIDRSIRYVRFLLEEQKVKAPSYSEICHLLFEEFENSPIDQPIVIKTVEKIKRLQKV